MLRLVRWTVLGLALLPCVAQQRKTAMNGEDASALARALAAYDEGDANARTDLERLASKYPANFSANEAVGVMYVEAGDAARAMPFLERAASAEKSNAAAAANLGAAFLSLGDLNAAVRTLRSAVALDPRNAAAQANLGRALYQAKRTDEAAKTFAKAAALDPTNTDALYNLAVALFDLHDDRDAVAALERIPAAQRTDAVESLWGDAEERRGRFQQAVEHLQSAARIHPTEPAVYAVTVELLRHWSWDTAAEVSAFGVERYPESQRLRMAQGIAAYGSGKYASAATIFGRLLAADPNSESYGDLLGRSCTAAGGSEAPACGRLIAFAEAHPKNAAIGVSAAVSLLHGSVPETHLDQAQRLLEAAIESDPGNADARYQFGVLQQQRLQWNESAASLEKAVELRPAFAEAHYRLSRAYAHLGDAARARVEIALQQKYSRQEKDETNARLKEVTTFLVASH